MDSEDKCIIANKYAEDTFQFIFWKQQRETLMKEGNKKGYSMESVNDKMVLLLTTPVK